ncbi:MAG: regulatory protein GemA [Parvibaculum sp.]|uniref:regulatory protein GemA n=1 Tax=Chelatococcus sp. TaxID=1953771 RepID=UPI001EC9E405|nr:regulatory protein GemA [Chelatococcus sp.]MBX3506860.1 regulatory protein GemA [Parvibaculum sp.]MBX3545566.1 regulatory protein GemA [Chelatococcus sp.]
MTATAAQIAAIHAEAKRAGLDEAMRRDLMQGVAGKRSARDLTALEAGRVIERLKGLSNGAQRPSKAARPPRVTVSGPYAAKLRALWLSAYNLGVAQSRDDAALLAFVERQTGLSHTQFLHIAHDATKAIEGLKAWIAREAAVNWPKQKDDVIGMKRAVILAQLSRAPDRAVAAFVLHCEDGAELDAIQQRLGKALRPRSRRARAA